MVVVCEDGYQRLNDNLPVIPKGGPEDSDRQLVSVVLWRRRRKIGE